MCIDFSFWEKVAKRAQRAPINFWYIYFFPVMFSPYVKIVYLSKVKINIGTLLLNSTIWILPVFHWCPFSVLIISNTVFREFYSDFFIVSGEDIKCASLLPCPNMCARTHNDTHTQQHTHSNTHTQLWFSGSVRLCLIHSHITAPPKTSVLKYCFYILS